MNFGQTVKNEIYSKPPREKHCKLAFLAGLIRGSGEIFSLEGNLGFQFKVSSDEEAFLIASLFKTLFNYDVRDVSVSEDKLNKKDKFLISVIGDKAVEILKALEVLIDDNDETVVNLKFYSEITKKECCLRWFVKGLFVSSGSCTLPNENTANNTGYHLEMVFSHYTPALETSEKIAEFGVITKITRRRENYILYIKSAEEIKDFLAFLPAPISVLKLTDIIINRGLSNNSNRQKNCDLGNVARQIEAVSKQIYAIDVIANTIGLKSLKEDLYETAIARKENPEDTLVELAEKLNVTKSCLNHRLRKIITISKDLEG